MLPKSGKWLTTEDLRNYIDNYGDYYTKATFLDIFPINHLPNNIPYLPLLFIINTNTSNLPGQHWKAIYIDANRNGEVFDSLATPISLNLEKWLNTHTRKWIVSSLILQHPLSPSCGAYVLYFILTRMYYPSLKACIQRFSANVSQNEQLIQHLFNQCFKL